MGCWVLVLTLLAMEGGGARDREEGRARVRIVSERLGIQHGRTYTLSPRYVSTVLSRGGFFSSKTRMWRERERRRRASSRVSSFALFSFFAMTPAPSKRKAGRPAHPKQTEQSARNSQSARRVDGSEEDEDGVCKPTLPLTVRKSSSHVLVHPYLDDVEAVLGHRRTVSHPPSRLPVFTSLRRLPL